MPVSPMFWWGYFKSENLGLNPDEPSVSGNISRVVEGVKIYDL